MTDLIEEECICDDIAYGEYCSEKCDSPYDQWKARMDAEHAQIRRDDDFRAGKIPLTST